MSNVIELPESATHKAEREFLAAFQAPHAIEDRMKSVFRAAFYLIAAVAGALAAFQAWRAAPLRYVPDHVLALPELVWTAYMYADKNMAAMFVLMPIFAVIVAERMRA